MSAAAYFRLEKFNADALSSLLYRSVVTPPLQLVSQFFEKESITIRHNQNAADIFKYSAGVKYNLIAGRKTNCVRLTMDNKING